MASNGVSYAREATAHLSGADPVLARVIDAVGPVKIALRRERFRALGRAIIFQQLAGAAAHTIYTRFVALFGGRRFPTPRQVLDAPPEDLRRAGLSRQKSLYLKDLAAHVANGTLNFHRFHKMDDEEIILDLTRVHGIGRWTAEMFLMFNLGRPDVLPVDDLGVRNAVRRLYRMRKRPDAKRLRALAERWRPYRSAASWYLWRSGDIVLPGGASPRRRRPARKKPRPQKNPAAKKPGRKKTRPQKNPE
ncbi:MAG TPA: DNA-3-methyladenine glycosylase [Candidatus Binataceae bacterium]|nr:DNA-3-methyladenine glycosylase [Candidatus Binataceae bacterium]